MASHVFLHATSPFPFTYLGGGAKTHFGQAVCAQTDTPLKAGLKVMPAFSRRYLAHTG